MIDPTVSNPCHLCAGLFVAARARQQARKMRATKELSVLEEAGLGEALVAGGAGQAGGVQFVGPGHHDVRVVDLLRAFGTCLHGYNIGE